MYTMYSNPVYDFVFVNSIAFGIDKGLHKAMSIG